MNVIRVTGEVDSQHRLYATVPESISHGKIDVFLVVPQPSIDDADDFWMEAIAREWREELNDPREDIYSLSDGEPVNGAP